MTDLWANIWVEPVILESRWWIFAAALAFSMILTVAISPGRRRYMGALKLAAAQGTQVMAPLAGVILVRSGFRHAYAMEGRGFWESMWLSLLWGFGFIVAGQIAVRTIPPTSWLLRDLRDANRAVWKARLGRILGGRR
ncbi:MAG: hypothetical protein K1X35_01220 [Caulobacteraceae bacterium]|nr:hypothetical protein [Caulobacteraceae bacterium]